MKQLGVGMAVIGVLLGGMTILGLRGTNWDYFLYMVALAGILYIRTPKEISQMHLHWKITAMYAAVSSFVILFVIVRELSGLGFDFSLAASFLIGGFIFLLLSRLEEKTEQEPSE
jgi:hypothetical protein